MVLRPVVGLARIPARVQGVVLARGLAQGLAQGLAPIPALVQRRLVGGQNMASRCQ